MIAGVCAGLADHFDVYDLEARVAVASNDELGALGRAFNEMIEEVATARAESEDTPLVR